MSEQMIFKRYELKYLLTKEQYEAIRQAMEPHMEPDAYGPSVIRNIYFDTDQFRLIRRSVEKPVYKEKLRMRSYRRADGEEPVFVELKKKYKSVVYKRRILMEQDQALECLSQGETLPVQTQIGDEINYFCHYYGHLQPTVFLSYERQAFCGREDRELRITFDQNIRFRREGFHFSGEIYGTPILEQGQILMEVKTPGGLPLWLVHCLSEHKIYKTSFSKYGAAYQKMMIQGGMEHV